MKRLHSPNQNYALILMFAGILTYIAVDSGLMDGSKFNIFKKSLDTSKPLNSQQSLLNYSHKLNDELVKVESELTTEKKKLSSLQRQVTNYETRLKQQKQNLKELDKEIQTLSNLKAALDKAQDNVKLTQKRKSNLVRKVRQTRKTASLNPLVYWSKPPASLTEIENEILNHTGAQSKVEAVSWNQKKYLRLNTSLIYDDRTGYYLTQRGIRQAAIFSEAGIRLGHDTIFLAYSDTSDLVHDRMSVVRRYLHENYGSRIKISSLQVSGDRGLKDGFELWMNKNGN